MAASSKYEAIIGLEVHAQLLTNTKIFCGCLTTFGADPNTNVCPVCLGLPGALPVLNRQVVHFAVKAALASHCRVNHDSVFARKNYFYPDLPKGYQISQYDRPLAEHGHLNVMVGKANEATLQRIGITRIHLEEDAGKLLHDSIGQPLDRSLVDLNRAGVPLIEIVSEPDIRSSEAAAAYLKTWRQIVRYLGICDGNLEEGSMRCDANVSVRLVGTQKFNTKSEIKNLNSFKNVQRAIDFEIARHIECHEGQIAIAQETRLWDAERGETRSMRSKEEAQDYRYFPDPDLRVLRVEERWISEIRGLLPELPDAKIERFQKEHGLSLYDAAFLTQDQNTAEYYEAAVKCPGGAGLRKEAANWIMGDLSRLLNRDNLVIAEAKIRPAQLVELLQLVQQQVISGKIAKEVFETMFAGGESPKTIVEREGLTQISDSAALKTLLESVVAAHPKEVEQYRQGRDKLFGFFVGQAMKASKGQGNPQLINELLKELLGPSAGR